jgi:hypothetical protein
MLILMALVLVPQGACMQVQIVPDIWSKKSSNPACHRNNQPL